MKSRTTTEFRKLFADLPTQVQEQTRAAYRQFKEDPSYPSLRFKKVQNRENRELLAPVQTLNFTSLQRPTCLSRQI